MRIVFSACLAASLMAAPSVAAAGTIDDGSYRTRHPVEVWLCEAPDDPPPARDQRCGGDRGEPDCRHIVPTGTAFEVVRSTDDVTRIRFWRWTNPGDEYAGFFAAPAPRREGVEASYVENAVPRYYCADTGELRVSSQPGGRAARWTFDAGGMTIPLRIRPSWGTSADLTVEPSISVSGAVVVSRLYRGTLEEPRLSLAMLLGLGISTVNVEELQVDPMTMEMDVENEGRSAVTLTLGASLQFGHASVGFATGLDLLVGSDRDDWDHDRLPWFGISVGGDYGFGVFGSGDQEDPEGSEGDDDSEEEGGD